VFILAAPPVFGYVELRPETAAAFDRAVVQAEARMNADSNPRRFLHIDGKEELKAKLRAGEPLIEPGSALSPEAETQIPGGLVQDWLGMVFIPGATPAQVKIVLQDYENYKNFYQPKVIESKQIAHKGDEYDVFLRLYEKHVLTVVLNANYHVRYDTLDAQRLAVTSHSTRIAEVRNPHKSYADEYPVGNDAGFLWRLNSYWRFQTADGGVYAECEAISLSRDLPLGFGFMLKGFLESFPKDSMMNTLRGTKVAVQQVVSAAR
jgi:hypothetical protein